MDPIPAVCQILHAAACNTNNVLVSGVSGVRMVSSIMYTRSRQVERSVWRKKSISPINGRVLGGSSSSITEEFKIALMEAGDIGRGEPSEESGLAAVSSVVRRGLGGGVL